MPFKYTVKQRVAREIPKCNLSNLTSRDGTADSDSRNATVINAYSWSLVDILFVRRKILAAGFRHVKIFKWLRRSYFSFLDSSISFLTFDTFFLTSP